MCVWSSQQGTCWPHSGHGQRWLPGAWLEPLSARAHTALWSTRPRPGRTRLSCILNGPLWPRNSSRGRTQLIWSGARRRESTSSLCTPEQTQLAVLMNCQECFPILEGHIPPCTPTDRGQSGSMLDLAPWRRATSSIKIILKVDFLCTFPFLSWTL